MGDVRFDALGRRAVILAPGRARRGAPTFEAFESDPAPCDFCGGHEDRTPPETFALRPEETPSDSPGWSVRVVPNLYPATPFHEVVVHTPDHYEHFEESSGAHRVDVLTTYQSRLRAASVASAIVVWNRGRAAGASRTHAHAQIFGVETVPPTLERECGAFADDPCVLCEMTSDDRLVVADFGGCRVVAHPAPFVAHEILIVGDCAPRFEETGELGPLADALADAVRRSLAVHGPGLPFNLVLHTAPRGVDAFHWHAHFMPRIATWGGLEMGAELPIVAADPYETAARLRDADI